MKIPGWSDLADSWNAYRDKLMDKLNQNTPNL